MAVFFPAPAKLNLFLHVIGRRSDGYHLLQTVFQFIDYVDWLSFSINDQGRVYRAAGPNHIPEDADLCIRAARLLQQVSGCKQGAGITLEKNIPLGGGLGGGSSDAATTLLALNHLWGIHLSRAELQELAVQLGADIPVFIFGQSAFAEGIGDQLSKVHLPEVWYVVLTPKIHVSTQEIFASAELTRNTIPIKMSSFSVGYGRNDLESVAKKKYPEIADCVSWLGQWGDSRMTGSGACVFAAFATHMQAQQVLDRKPDYFSGFIARGVGEHPLYSY